jgi:hypothetical protein
VSLGGSTFEEVENLVGWKSGGFRGEVFSVRRWGKTNRVLLEVVEGVLGREEQSR